MKKYSITFMIARTTVLSNCGGKDHETFSDDSAPIVVEVSQVKVGNHQPFIAASGRVEAANTANLSTRIMGHVSSIKVKVGDQVKKGDLLLSIHSEDILAKRAQVYASIAEVTAALKNAEKDYNRYKALFAKQSATQKELDDMTAHYKMAKARLERAEQLKNEINAQFAYTNIRAPFYGTITNLFIESGDLANPGMPLIAMEAPGAFEVTASVPESEITKIFQDSTVQVMIKALDITLKGEISEISTSAKQTGGQYLVKVVLSETNALVYSGMFATVHFPVKGIAQNSMVLIPQDAIVEKGQLTGIYTVSQSNTALLRWLRLGRIYEDQVEVLAGLTANETFIRSAESKLYNGAKLTIQ